MGVVTTKSGNITNRDAVPRVKNNAAIEGGALREICGSVEIATGDSSASKYILCSVPSNARISQLLVYSDDCGTATVLELGLWRTTADGGAVVDLDLFATGLDVHGGALSGVDVVHEAATTSTTFADIQYMEKRLWEVLGLSSDPGIMYDIVAYCSTAADVGGTFAVKCRYVA